MVSDKINQRTTIIVSIITLIISAVSVFCFYYFTQKPADDEPVVETVAEPEPELEPEPEPEPTPEFISFQTIVDEWADNLSGNKSVLIYDLDLQKMAASYNPDEDYNTASLYKLFVVYEGYRRVMSGEWNGEETAGYTGYTINKCLDLAIRESYSPCAETLWSSIGHAELDEIISTTFNITNSNISTLVSNAPDILKIMQLFYEHTEFNDEIWAAIQDSMLNQPVTTYDWRQGLPSGFSDTVNVYNKVGWQWGTSDWLIYHDAAIVEFPEANRHYIVVVMTNHVDNKDIARLGTLIETEFNKY